MIFNGIQKESKTKCIQEKRSEKMGFLCHKIQGGRSLKIFFKERSKAYMFFKKEDLFSPGHPQQKT